MLEYIAAMLFQAFTVVLIIGTLALFVSAAVLRKRTATPNPVLLKIFKVYCLLILAGLAAFGGVLFIAGIQQIIPGKISAHPLLLLGGGLSFIGAAAVTFYIFFVSAVRAARRLERRKKEHPDAPWMWTDKWLDKKIVYSSTGTLIFVWFVILVVIGGFVLIPYLNREAILAKMQGVSLFEVVAFSMLILFILVPALLMAISWTRGQLKFGKSTFEMSTRPGFVGGQLAGTIYTRVRDIPKEGFVLDLECQFTDLKRQGPGRTRDLTAITIWQTKKKVAFGELKMGLEGVLVPVSFSIPSDVQETDEWSPDKRIDWMVSASASVKRTQYLSQFIVPIFKTSQRTTPR